MNILISGGNGFLGSALANALIDHGYNLYLLTRSHSNLKRLYKIEHKLKIIKFSSDHDLKIKLIDIHPDIVINTACNYGRNGESLLEIFDSNYRLGLLLLNHFCTLNNKIHFLNIGTVIEDNINNYSFSKSQFAQLGKFVSSKYNHIVFKNILLQHMFGPGDDDSKFTSYVLNTCINNKPILDLTEGNQMRDFIYIKDVVDAITILLQNIEKVQVADIEIGSGRLIKIKDFVLKIRELSNSNTKLNFGAIPYRGDEVNLNAANLSVLSNLGWFPKYTIEEGLSETIKNYIK